MNIKTIVIFVVYLISPDGVNGIYANDPHACGKYVSRKKPNGQYHEVQVIFCCPDYMEVNSKCIACEPGYFGKNCSVPCIGKSFGPQCKSTCNCNESQTCDRKFGCVCVAAGYTGNECRTVCQSGLFGPGCRQRCSCSSHANCDPVNGYCACHKGYEGQYCTRPCSPGTYGSNCLGNCSCPDCDPVTGACTAQTTTSENGSIIIGAVVGFLVLLIGLGVLIWKYRRSTLAEIRLQNKSREDTDSCHYEEIDDYAEIADVPNTVPYNYAYSDDFKPPVKERIPTTKRKTNQYLSITDTERISKLEKSRVTDSLDLLSELLKEANCGSSQNIIQTIKERSSRSSGWSNVSESGYLRPRTEKEHDINANLSSQDHTDNDALVRYCNNKEIQESSRPESGSISQSEKGDIQLTDSVKKGENWRAGMIETTSPNAKEDLRRCGMIDISPPNNN